MISAGQLQTMVGNVLSNSIGQRLMVTHPETEQGSGTSTELIYCLPQPLNADGQNLLIEAGYNVSEGNMHDFVCAGNANVGEKDLITYDGQDWRVLNINKSPLGNTAPVKHCFAVRQ